MDFRFHHVHVKTRDPKKSAEWFVKTFNFSILSDVVRAPGDRMIRCLTEDGAVKVFFSGNRRGENLPEGIVGAQFGIEHLAFESEDIDKDIERLVSFGARVDEQPTAERGGSTTVFLITPEGIRIELVQPSIVVSP